MTAMSGITVWDATPTESAAPTRGKNATEPAASDTPVNAFAAALAAVMGTRATPVATDKKVDQTENAVSDLDANGSEAISGGAIAVTAAATAGVTVTTAPMSTSVGVAAVEGSSGVVGTSIAGAGAASGRATHASPLRGDARGARDAANAAPMTHVNSDSDALNPDFRVRLGRVVTRMHEEYGHEVELVEGFRPQGRQEFLYEQGRTRPGNVVTWTKSSKHTLGLAADLKIDGSYDNTVAYRHLAQIAAQEGLRTLGARDPGHIELPSRGGAVAWGATPDTSRINEGVSRAVGLAMAQGAAASAVGTEANRDSGDNPHALNGMLSRMSQHGASAQVSAAPFAGNSGGGTSAGFGQHERRHAEPDVAIGKVAEVAHVADVAQIAQVADVAQIAQSVARSGVLGTASVAGPHVVAPVDSADRVGRMLDVRDATPAQPLSHVTLDLDNANGGTDRITVQLRGPGGAVDTAISLGDKGGADRMSLRVGELQHALEHHGLEAGSIHVASTAGESGAGWTPRRGSDQDAHQGQPSRNNRDNRQDADEARQRSRREQQGGKRK